jgi:hypothetical protein
MIDEGSGCGNAELTVTNLLVQQQQQQQQQSIVSVLAVASYE